MHYAGTMQANNVTDRFSKTETNLLKVWTVPHIFQWELNKTFPQFFEIIKFIKNSKIKQEESDTTEGGSLTLDKWLWMTQ